MLNKNLWEIHVGYTKYSDISIDIGKPQKKYFFSGAASKALPLPLFF